MQKDRTRPVTVRMEQFKEELNKAVLHSELPAYILEILMGQYLMGISKVAREEYAQEQAEWETAQRVQPEKARDSRERG